VPLTATAALARVRRVVSCIVDIIDEEATVWSIIDDEINGEETTAKLELEIKREN